MPVEWTATVFALFSLVIWLGRLVWRVVRRFRPRVTLGDAMTGTVYILWDRSLSDVGVIKIGVTRRRDITVRIEEIRRDMGGDPVCIWKLDHVPFPASVEFVAHRFMARWRVTWVRGSRRGTEWFYAKGEKGIGRAIAAVEKAARRVRRIARKKKRWPTQADGYISVWTMSEGKISRTYPFRSGSFRMKQGKSPGGGGSNKAKANNKPTSSPRPHFHRPAAATRSGQRSRG